MLMGAHAPPLVRPTTNIIIIILPLLFSFSSSAQPIHSSQILLNFKTSLSNAAALANWAPSTNPCSPAGTWTGVLCSDENHIWGLQLEKMNLSGEIDVASLVSLPLLRSLSFMNNQFEGPMPDVRKLGALKSLFLSNNRFSGEIPDDAFMGMASLKKVYIANNNFTGNIPTSLAKSPRLLELRLENNHFVGLIPDFPPDLKLLNVSNNRLEGPIPKNLVAMNTTSFSGNAELCGKPLDSVCKASTPPPAAAEKPPTALDPPTTSPPTTDTSDNNSSSLRTALIVIATLVALAAMVVLFIVYRRRSRDSQTPQLGRTLSSSYTNHTNNDDDDDILEANNQVGSGAASMSGAGAAQCRSSKGSCDQQQHGRLTFVREERQRFELQDLLRASAEVLGSGSFGSSYKAVLMDGQAVVVKRFKQMNTVGKEEFHEHMRRLGRLRHPNLLPLVAYYYRKEEKLLVFDFVHNGSLATQLHGNQSVEHPGLDWPTRLKIIKGVTQGLAYLHTELPSLTLPHGHLKSSNVLLDKSFHPVLMDYTLVPVVNPDQAHQFMVAYKSPEFALHGRATKKTDSWSLGILILEILTGKSPANYLAQGSGYGSDLASWVTTINGEESTQVFDRGMGSTENGEGEMMKLLRIGVGCCHEDLERRLDVKEAVEKIELLKERDDLW